MVMSDFDELDQYNTIVEELKDIIVRLDAVETRGHVDSEMVLQNIQSYIMSQMDLVIDSMKEIKHRIQNSEGKVA